MGVTGSGAVCKGAFVHKLREKVGVSQGGVVCENGHGVIQVGLCPPARRGRGWVSAGVTRRVGVGRRYTARGCWP